MITTRKATFDDLDEMLIVEKASIKGNHYLEGVHKEFFTDPVGEMIVAEDDGVICGIGKITFQYNGDAWLETLRVHPDHQNKGVGKAIWKRYMEVAAMRHPQFIRMYTGTGNKTSRHIAELNNVDRAFMYSECSDDTDHALEVRGWEPVTFEQVKDKIPEIRNAWGNYACYNRTFYALDVPFVKAMCEEGKMFTDGENIVSVGARFLPERGYNLGFMLGDYEKCIKFALWHAHKNNAPKLAVMHRTVDKKVRAITEKLGFEYLPSNLLMMEGDFE
ncbi:MAG: GNAT family N-acetyltransferase [Clostridia bacterium]|nr:GNAT family N-acetyltransferase [Clostridia bacterium]MBQ6933748.1 GNAT family N-acetyltransferase [Clostridia bacterium]MBQ7088013.1 GNAT family N-acetyltransferase [Clostridia bacterium]